MADDNYDIDSETLEIATKFFKNDYHDRGMVKWQSFFLSDHLKDEAKNKVQEEKAMSQKQMPSMTDEEISKILFNAYRKVQTIEYQLKEMTIDGLYPEIEAGKVKGYADSTIVIGSEKIDLEQINWRQLTER